MMIDRRTTIRQRVFKSGTIEFDGKNIECTIRNVSPSGAALDVPSPAGIPHEITVNFTAGNTRQRGHIVWRKEKRVGVSFA
jgi:PilZ domain